MHRRQLLAFTFFFFTFASIIQPCYAAKKGYIAPEQVPGTTLVSAAEAKALYDANVVFIDVRSPRLHNRRHIPGAVHLDLKDTYDEESLSSVAKKDQQLVIYCRHQVQQEFHGFCRSCFMGIHKGPLFSRRNC